MTLTPDPWSRLVAAARRASAASADEVVAPPGFATRVVARAFAPVGLEHPLVSLIDRFSWRALALAGALAAASVMANLNPAVQVFAGGVVEQDPVAVVLDVER